MSQDVAETESVRGQIRVWTLDERLPAYVRVSSIAAVIALKDGGPTRLLFTGGGHLDVCGPAETWRLKIRIVELEELSDAAT